MRYDILPLRVALTRIFLITCLISGSTGLAIWLYKWHDKLTASDEKYKVTTLLQHTTGAHVLKQGYLEELLDLSADAPMYLPLYNLKAYTSCLKASPYIEKASIKKKYPDTLVVDYTLKKPIARLGDLKSALLDKKGRVMPFFAKEHADLPELILGNSVQVKQWGEPLFASTLERGWPIFMCVLKECENKKLSLRQVNLSRIDASSAGRREVIVVIAQDLEPLSPIYYLRLDLDHYQASLENFWILLERAMPDKNISGSQTIVDLRVPLLAFLLKLQ